MTKKKTGRNQPRNVSKKKLAVSTEKVRPLGDEKLGDVAGAATCTGSRSGFYVCALDR